MDKHVLHIEEPKKVIKRNVGLLARAYKSAHVLENFQISVEYICWELGRFVKTFVSI